MEKEDILINLKVLENVQVHQKVISRSQYLNIEYVSIIPVSLRRWIRQDNRNLMLNKIRLTVNSALKISNDNEDIQSSLLKCVTGLKNLKETYSHCIQTQAQLDVLIDAIEN